MTGRTPWLLVLATAVALGACGSSLRAFPNDDPMVRDDDRQPFSPKPDEYFSGLIWDGADQSLFRPMARFFAVDPGGEAVNVTALDEVPDSAWFTNRIGPKGMPIEDLLRGACEGPSIDPSGPWTVTGAKPNGENPGFLIKAQDGQRYLLKFDGALQQPRATAADVIGSRIYDAAGYAAPCNEITHFDEKILVIAADATAEGDDGEEEPLQAKHLAQIFAKARRGDDGLYRANASRFLPGRPLGPWRYEGTRDDDPNDVVPHEDRRELRGAAVLASWLNHFDSREQNTLDMWVKVDGERGYVQHHYLDFGDCFGSLWEWDQLSRRWGHSFLFDYEHIGVDFITFGALERPWDVAAYGKAGEVFGYYGREPFDPGAWHNEYPNPAFERMTEHDAAWMARIIARFDDEAVDAVVELGHFWDPVAADELRAILKYRRDKILRRWFKHLSPLSHPRLEAYGTHVAVCLEDLAVTAGVAGATRTYEARGWLGLELKPVEVSRVLGPAREGEVCVRLPATKVAREDMATYVIVDVIAEDELVRPGPARVHLYQTGATAYRLVGLERPEDRDAPGD